MFIAHLPAGYIASRFIPKTRTPRPILIGSIAPDLDLLLVFLGGIQMHHHLFLTHRPAFWAGLLIAGLLMKRWGLAGLGLGALVHVALDSVTGRINWLWPFADGTVTLVQIQARYDWWVWSFLLHPVFLLELAICAIAVMVWWLDPARNAKNPDHHGRGSSKP